MYAIINNSEKKYPISFVSSFETQNGNIGIRVEGEMPQTSEGFKIYDDADNMVGDYSEFTYPYGANEYTKETEEKIPAQGSDAPLPPSTYDNLIKSIGRVSNKVNKITPYTASKNVYIDDTECEFDLVKNGDISAWLVSNGSQIPCNFEVVDNKIIVSFDALEAVGTVNISSQ